MATYAVKKRSLDNQSQIAIAEAVLSELEKYKTGIDSFYETQRMEIHQKNLKKLPGVIVEKLECCKELYKLTIAMILASIGQIEQCHNLEDRVFLSNWVMNFHRIIPNEIIHILGTYHMVNDCRRPLEKILEIREFQIRPSDLAKGKEKAEKLCEILNEAVDEIEKLFETREIQRRKRMDYIISVENSIL